MLQGSELALDRAQIERSMNRESAVLAKGRLQGYNFIRLSLKNIRKRKISGIDILEATEFSNAELGGVTDYHLELKGGTIDFRWYPEYGMFLYDMVDTERNREFLATHYEYHFWDIMDEKVEKDVILRLDSIKKELLAKPKPDPKAGPAGFWDEVEENRKKQLAAVRGEVERDPNVPVQEVTEEVANEPDKPGFIPGQEKPKTPYQVNGPEFRKEIGKPGRKRVEISISDRIKFEKQKRERQQRQSAETDTPPAFPGSGATQSAGVGVVQP